MAYMNVMSASRAPMLNNAGRDTTSANSSFLMPLAAWNKIINYFVLVIQYLMNIMTSLEYKINVWFFNATLIEPLYNITDVKQLVK